MLTQPTATVLTQPTATVLTQSQAITRKLPLAAIILQKITLVIQRHLIWVNDNGGAHLVVCRILEVLESREWCHLSLLFNSAL